MKKLLLIFAFALISSITMAQTTKVFIDDKPSTKEELHKIPIDQIASMANSIEDGAAVMRVTLKKGTFKSAEINIDVKPDSASVAASKARIAKAIQDMYDKSTILKKGDMAADFTATKYSGTKFKLSDHKGKVVLLNFWATWCAPCLRELAPEGLPTILQKFASDSNFVFIPVAYTNTAQELTTFFATENGKTTYDYLRPITAMDADKAIFSLYATSGVPRSIIIGKDGRIILGSLGANEAELKKMEAAIAAAIGDFYN